jgi:hypothetical protein
MLMNVDEGVDVVYGRAVKLSGQRLTALVRALSCHHPHDRDISFIVVSILRYLLFPGGHSAKFAYSLQFD